MRIDEQMIVKFSEVAEQLGASYDEMIAACLTVTVFGTKKLELSKTVFMKYCEAAWDKMNKNDNKIIELQ